MPEKTQARRRGPDLCYGAALLVLALLLWAPRLTGPIDLRYDAGVYYVLGTSLAQGRGYRLLNEPGAIEAVQYPPLLPACVAAHQWALGSDDPAVVGRWLRRSYCLLSLVYVLAVYALARQYLAPPLAALTGLVTVLYLHTILLSDLLFAEIPFALAATLFVLSDRLPGWAVRQGVAGLCGVAAYLLRSAGVALLAAWVADSLLRGHWKEATLRAAVSLLPVLAWQSHVSRVTSSQDYKNPAYEYQRAAYQYYNVSYAENVLLVDPFVPELGRASGGDMARRVLGNIVRLPVDLGNGVMEGERLWKAVFKAARSRLDLEPPMWVALVPSAVVGCLVLAGLGFLLARGERLIPLCVAASAGLIWWTPWPGQLPRYMTPLTPLLALALATAVGSIRAYADRQQDHRRWVLRVGCAIIILGVLATEAVLAGYAYLVRQTTGLARGTREGDAGRMFYYDEAWADFDMALAWLRERGRPDEILASTAPHWAYLKTGLRAVMPPMEIDRGEGQRLLDSVPATYVVVDELEFLDVIRRYTDPTIQAHPEQWELIHTVPGSNTRVYRRVGW